MRVSISIALVSFLIVIILSACSKNKFPKKYTGDFTFTIISISHHQNGSRDTTIYNGYIKIIDKKSDQLEIRYGPGKNFINCNYDTIWGARIEPTVDEDGNLYYPKANECGANQQFTGRFLNSNEVTFNMATGGLGGWFEQSVYGVKTDSK